MHVCGFNPRLRAGGDVLANPDDPVALEFQSTPPRGRRRPRRAKRDEVRRVSIHASAREATRTREAASSSTACFNPRLRAGGDLRRHPGPRGDRVSIHASAREATVAVGPRHHHAPVSIHASAREATIRARASSAPFLFQSTPPRGRRRQSLENDNRCSAVSIHASAREATDRPLRLPGGAHVSIHASAREATCRPCQVQREAYVSIHASAREATMSLVMSPGSTLFQSTPPRGRRRLELIDQPAVGLFQSTPPRGRRPTPRRAPSRPRCFNPRLRAGGDARRQARRPPSRRFNPRLRAGGDKAVRGPIMAHPCFNPRLRAGGDGRSPARSTRKRCFNPRLRAGGDGLWYGSHAHTTVSIHASAREATVTKPSVAGWGLFQSTPPRGRRLRWTEDLREREVSIHASAREATRCPSQPLPTKPFQSTPPRGRRPLYLVMEETS